MAQSNIIKVTTNVTDELLLVTDENAAGVSVMIGAGDSIGGGTMSLGVLPQSENSADSDFSVAYIDATLDAGHNQYYRVGANMAVYIKLSGATSPNVSVIAAEVLGLD